MKFIPLTDLNTDTIYYINFGLVESFHESVGTEGFFTTVFVPDPNGIDCFWAVKETPAEILKALGENR